MQRLVLILAVLACLTACKRSINDSGCISRYTGPAMYSWLKPGQLDTIKSVFAANGLSPNNYQFTSYYSDTLKGASTSVFNQVITAAPIINGLAGFNAGFTWTFQNGVWYTPYNFNPQYPYPGSDTTGHFSLPDLRSLFFKTYEAALFSNPNSRQDIHLGRPSIYYHDSCLNAQLGYIDAAYQPNSNIPTGNKLLKVWRVTPQGFIRPITMYTLPQPAVYVIDSTGQTWCDYPTFPGQQSPPCPYCNFGI
jgi:hypothetical protein